MKKKTLFTSLLALALSAQIALPSGSAQSPKGTQEISVVINGVKVHGDGTRWASGTGWVDAKGYSELLGLKYSFKEKKKEFKVNGKTLAARIYNGRPAVKARDIAKATGAENVLLDRSKKVWEYYVLDLPNGSISLEGTKDVMAPGVPGMGQHWGSPAELPLGPIYGVEKGKLVFIEQMISQEDFANGKNYVNIPGMKGLPSPAIVHSDVEFVPHGHPGFEVPHFDIHHYFVTHKEHLKFSMPPGGTTPPGHQH
ncbi:hypothetical protein [Peribacillus glennii]|uniref:Uncharacterized protein n=1 Tax=Peribacillus glennii TaxID=2303991 RepID=A0A372L8E1_9BACI|nr:hypothetical protein [Peribacillus glennii]RFU61125.1 hypothetical protein D0466_19275 [Peribacillus glennii]